MDAVPEPDLRELARNPSNVLSQVHQLASDRVDDGLADCLARHLGVDPRGLPVLSHELPSYQLVYVQVALDAPAGAVACRAGLPDATLEQIDRHVVGIASHESRLRASGQHVKRGVLLYGPPETGKTHTVRYLLSSLPKVTAFNLSGQALQLIGQACDLARLLQPSMVILEDVDLIAADRSIGPMGSNPLLFEVLNQIDGLGDDVNVTFLLTTNRVDILEPALAEGPGRADAAVEIAPPDAVGRARLFRLYGAGVGLDQLTDDDMADSVTATAGRKATYLREVVRRAALKVRRATVRGSTARRRRHVGRGSRRTAR